MNQGMSFSAFLDSATANLDPYDAPSLELPDLGVVNLTTLTKANLALLRQAQRLGYPGLLVCCPDFEREAIAVAFLAGLLHIEFDNAPDGLHEAETNEKVAVGNCVVEITEVNDQQVMYRSFDQSNLGILKSCRSFPLVHHAAPDSKLSRTRNTKKRKRASLINEAERYNALPAPQRRILDSCGKNVPSVGYVSSPSQYANEAPTRLLNGRIIFDGITCSLSEVLPVTYLTSKGDARNSFSWPFDCPPSVIIGPRVDGVGSASQVIDLADEGRPIDFVALNISSPDLLDTALLSDILDLKDRGIGVIAFCDRWTLSRLQPLVDNDFLPFDWDDCTDIAGVQGLSLSSIQRRALARQHEKVLPVSDENSGLLRAKQILYDELKPSDLDDDEVLSAVQDLFGVLGAAIRMTEAPDKEYSDRQKGLVDEALDVIRVSRVLNQQDFNEVSTACEILSAFFKQGHLAPKEQKIYDLITHYLGNELPVVLVVDRNRTEAAYNYWCGELALNGYNTDLFTVMTTRAFLGSNTLAGNENAIAVRWLQLSPPPIFKPPVQGAFSFLGRGNLETPWLRFRPNADQSHGRTAEMLSIELCFSLHMDRLWRKAPSFAANRATRVLKLPLSGHKEPQAAAAGGLPSETDGLGRKEPGFGNGQQGRGVGARVRARGVHGAGQRARACALLSVPGEAGGIAPRGAQVPLRRVRPGGDSRGGLPRARRRRGARGGAGRGEGGVFSRRTAAQGRGRRAERDQGIDFPQGRRALIPARAPWPVPFSSRTSAYIRMYAYAHMRNRTFSFLRICAITHLHIWVDTDTGCGRGPAMDDHGGMAYGKERVSREAGRHGEDDGRR